jgi:hypothetical protein
MGTSHNHTDGETPSITVRWTGILLGQQTPRSERRQNSYTAAHGQPIQALANQRTQLQLRLQLACTEPSFNGIKRGPQQAKSVNIHDSALNERASHQFISSSTTSRAFRSAVPSAAPPSAGVHCGSSPHLRGQQLYTP